MDLFGPNLIFQPLLGWLAPSGMNVMILDPQSYGSIVFSAPEKSKTLHFFCTMAWQYDSCGFQCAQDYGLCSTISIAVLLACQRTTVPC